MTPASLMPCIIISHMKAIVMRLDFYLLYHAWTITNLWQFDSTGDAWKSSWIKFCNYLHVYCIFLDSAGIVVYLATPISLCRSTSGLMVLLKSQWIMQVWQRTSHTEREGKKTLSQWLCTPLKEYRQCVFQESPFKCHESVRIIMFSRNSSFYLASALVGLSVSKGRSWGAGARWNLFYGFWSPQEREPDTSVEKNYLSTQKQARERVVREEETWDCTEESARVQLLSVGQRQQPGSWGEHHFLQDKIK